MGKIVLEQNGKLRRVEDIEFAEKIREMRKNNDHWTVIDKLVKVWAEVAPDDEQAVKINIQQYRETLVDKVYAQTTVGQDQERRFILAFPKSLMLMIRTQYKAEDLPMDQKFFREFAKRYPAFKVSEKI